MIELHKKWIEALRSGEYKQGSGVYCKIVDGEPRYCCLGVLAKVAGFNYTVDAEGDVWWEGSTEKMYVQDAFLERMKLSGGVLGNSSGGQLPLWYINDVVKLPFNKIADHLEKYIEQYVSEV